MEVKMQTIMAGPEGTADVGQTISVNDKFGKALKDGRFATDPGFKPTAPATATAVAPAGDGLKQDGPTVAEFVKAGYSASNYPPAGYASKSTPEEVAEAIKAEEAERVAKAKSPESVEKALGQLNPEDDEDWTAAGKPAMSRVEALIGTKEITRAELDEMFPDFRRPAPSGEGGPGTGPGTGVPSGSSNNPSNDPGNGEGSGTGGPAPTGGRGARSNRP